MKTPIDLNAKPSVDVSGMASNLHITIGDAPTDVAGPANVAYKAWQRDAERQIAGLARLPEMVLVRQLRARRQAAGQAIESLQARIDSMKESAFSAAPEKLESAVATVAGQITETEHQIAMHRLTLEACERALPGAIAKRDEVFRTALIDLTNDLQVTAQADHADRRVKLWGKLAKDIEALLTAQTVVGSIVPYQSTKPDVAEEWAIANGIVAAPSPGA